MLTPVGIGAALAVEGATGAAFVASRREVLVPTLRPGQVVVLDNLAVHQAARARALVKAAGGRLLFLLAYLPDLTPIEFAFATLKQAQRLAAARTHDALVEAIGAALAALTPAAARAFCAACGYLLQDQLL